jgi:hypothetical protein
MPPGRGADWRPCIDPDEQTTQGVTTVILPCPLQERPGSALKCPASPADNPSCCDSTPGRPSRSARFHLGRERAARMRQGMPQKEAVRLAKEKLGNATNVELAVWIQEALGLTIKPAIVTVLLGTLQEREALDRSGQSAREKINQWQAENPEEAKKLAAAAKRREAARRKAGSSKSAGGEGESQQVSAATAAASDSSDAVPAQDQPRGVLPLIPCQVSPDSIPDNPACSAGPRVTSDHSSPLGTAS